MEASKEKPVPTETEKWRRLTNPKSLEDWGLSVNFDKLMEENPALVSEEISPFLGANPIKK